MIEIECKKCGCTNIRTTWFDEIKAGSKVMGIKIEPRDGHLLRECMNCGYEWKDEPLDKKIQKEGNYD